MISLTKLTLNLLWYTIQPISGNQVRITQVSYPNEGYDDAYYSSNTQGNGGNE